MARSRNRRGHDRSRMWKIFMAIIITMFVMCIGVFLLTTIVVEPNMEDIAEIRAEVLVSRTINKALTEQFGQEHMQKDLFTIKSGEDGTMEVVQANSIEINVLMSQLSINLQEAIQNMKREEFDVPVGSLLGSKILSQTGPEVAISIIPMSISSMDFKTEFETQGINQTKYKIYIVLGCRVKVLAPFASGTFTTENTVLIAEAVILGEVPNSYVEVPKEDILDVTDE